MWWIGILPTLNRFPHGREGVFDSIKVFRRIESGFFEMIQKTLSSVSIHQHYQPHNCFNTLTVDVIAYLNGPLAIDSEGHKIIPRPTQQGLHYCARLSRKTVISAGSNLQGHCRLEDTQVSAQWTAYLRYSPHWHQPLFCSRLLPCSLRRSLRACTCFTTSLYRLKTSFDLI